MPLRNHDLQCRCFTMRSISQRSLAFAIICFAVPLPFYASQCLRFADPCKTFASPSVPFVAVAMLCSAFAVFHKSLRRHAPPLLCLVTPFNAVAMFGFAYIALARFATLCLCESQQCHCIALLCPSFAMGSGAERNYAFAIHLGASRCSAIALQRLSLLAALIFAALSLCNATAQQFIAELCHNAAVPCMTTQCLCHAAQYPAAAFLFHAPHCFTSALLNTAIAFQNSVMPRFTIA